MMPRIHHIAVGIALALSGCTVGPDYQSPQAEAPAQRSFGGAGTDHVTNEPPPGQWWQLYDVAALNGYIQEALKANKDLKAARANLERARAALRETRSVRFPSTTVETGVTYGRESAAAQGQNTPFSTDTTFDAGLDATYQVDLLGRVTRAIEASRADAEAVTAGYDLVRITVAAEVARAYADACTFGRQVEVARRSLDLQQRQYEITQRELKVGRGTGLDVARAATLVEQTRAQIPSLRASHRNALYRLAVLMGRPPTDFPKAAAECTTAPRVEEPIPVGDGADLLRRRPDVRRAERELAAATARIGVATAELYPNVTLGGSIGTTALSLDGMGDDEALRFGIGPLISWSFPNILAAEARIDAAEATAKAALADFEGTWLAALQEVEGALANYANQLDRVRSLQKAREESARAAKLARTRFDAGSVSFIDVLDAERTLAETSMDLAQARGQLSAHQIALFLALGGGWS